MRKAKRRSTRCLEIGSRKTSVDGPFTISASKRKAAVGEINSSFSVGEFHSWTAVRSDSGTLTISSHRSPDTAGVKNKMLFASSKETLRVALSGALTTVQATDGGEASYEAGTCSICPS